MAEQTLQALYDRKYTNEVWRPLVLHPNAISTTRYDDVARLLRTEQGRFLEVGCGAGQLVIALAGQFVELVGVDLSQVRIANAQRALANYPQYSTKVQFKVSTAPNSAAGTIGLLVI